MDPLISVALVTYNQENYLAQAIDSVLDQSFANLELVIVDDGSSDSSAEIACTYNDERVSFIRQENQGPSGAVNTAISAARGRYIALLSGDDFCHPDRLEKQLAGYEAGKPRILFSDCRLVDENSNPVDDSSHLRSIFQTDPLSQG